ncbi:MAG: rhomboid family intramembrane serine protease [Sneathiella sp.]|nr:rhomboid family intramembrane serine protease [Sneathiella sp.]
MRENSQNREPVFNVPPVTVYLVAAIFIVHLLLTVTTQDTFDWFYQNFSFHPAVVAAVLHDPSLPGLVQLFVTLNSHLFLHNDWTHMILNAGMLLAFGSMVERRFGAARYLILYFLSGWIGAFTEFAISDPDAGITLYGASAAVFGAMGATAIILLPRFRLQGVLTFIAVLLGINLVIGATPLGELLAGPGVEIAWVAHVGGFAAGLLLALLYSWKSPVRG